MSKPSSHILTTDYPTIKNDGVGVFSISIPASIVIQPTGTYSYEQEVTTTIGSAGALLRLTAQSNRDTREFVGMCFMSIGYGYYTLDGVNYPNGYNIMIDIFRKTSTTLAIHVYIPNTGYPAAPLTTENFVEVITVKVATFLSPFNLMSN